MSILESFLLGVAQGLTEFLPISSSGHLVFFQSLFGIKEPQICFDIILHISTLLAVLIFFWSDIRRILHGLMVALKNRKITSSEVHFFFLIIIATLPTGIMGLFFKDWLESLFSKPKVVGGMLLITGIFLWLTRWAKKEGRLIDQMRWIDALLIGVFQGVAIIPGISRSGITISTGLFLGLDRELCGKFSFLLSIPSILGATLLEFPKIDATQKFWIPLTGAIFAFGVGVLSLFFLMKMVKKGKLFSFSYYCWGLGVLMMILNW